MKLNQQILRKTLLLLLILTNGMIFSQSKEYSGVIKDKGSNLPLPGVNIVVKGTKIGTQSDFDGNFKINVPDSLKVLTLSYLGFQTLDLKLKTETYIEVILKEDCTKCWFDTQKIGIYANSGLINNPIGGLFKFTFPSFYKSSTLISEFSYQTNLNENRLLNASLNLHHLFVSCDFDADINSSYRNLDFNNRIDLSAFSIETSLNFKKINTIIGVSQIDFINASENKNVNSIGPIIGLATWIGQPFLMSVSAKTTIYENLSEYHAEIKKRHKGVYGFLKYYKVDSFNELSLGIGFEFTYLLKSQRR